MAEQKRISRKAIRTIMRQSQTSRVAGRMGGQTDYRSSSATSSGFGRQIDAAVRDFNASNEW